MNNLKKIRESKGMTQEQLADKCDMKQQYLSGIENGTRNIWGISTRNVWKIAKALGCSIEDLLGEENKTE